MITYFFKKIKKIVLFLGDLIILYLSLWLTLVLRYSWTEAGLWWSQHFWPFTIVYLIWLVIFFINRFYELGRAENSATFAAGLLRISLINAIVAMAFFYFIPNIGIAPKRVLFLNIVLAAILFFLWRRLYNHFVRSPLLLNNLLIIGLNEQAIELIQKINKKPQLGYKLVAVINNDQNEMVQQLPIEIEKINLGLANLDLSQILRDKKIQTIVTALDHHQNPELVRQLYQNLDVKTNFLDLPSFYEKLTGKIPVNVIGEVWFLENLTEGEKILYETIKRLLDIILASTASLFSLFLIPFIALAIKIDSPGPILFKQYRVGKAGKLFLALKFRTMKKDAEKNGPQWAMKDDPRITRIGNFLRKTRLDEIPQLINILRSEMSFVGPRPERPEFIETLEKQIPFYRQRLLARPGLTGWAQINFPYGASVGDALEKLQYDLFYIKNRSLVLDFSIVLKTINIVFRALGR